MLLASSIGREPLESPIIILKMFFLKLFELLVAVIICSIAFNNPFVLIFFTTIPKQFVNDLSSGTNMLASLPITSISIATHAIM